MMILGIHDGHNSGATLLRDGSIVASVCEERLSRVKNDVGYPRRSIDEVLSIGGIEPGALDSVVYASNFMHTVEHLRSALEWYRVGAKDQEREQHNTKAYLKAIFDSRRAERLQQVQDHLQCRTEQVSFVEHHLAHAAAAYYGSPFTFDEPVLLLTCDGAGDGLSSTVSIGHRGSIERIAFTGRDASLGKIYSRVTYLLGMTPWEHEYKVMGLAPYADPERARRTSEIFRELVMPADDGLTFRCGGSLQSSYIYEFLRDKLERLRFDEISGAVQLFTEQSLCAWVKRCIAKTGIRRIACGGGVFMNVKANLRISELEEVDEMFVFPSCGDESLSFGAVWHEFYRRRSPEERTHGPAMIPLDDLYLGREFSDGQITSALTASLSGQNCSVERHDDIEQVIAERLADNRVIARFAGRMEWGARALGNRSILANPREWKNVEKINSMIKMRDFWIPFSPSMLKEDQGRYLRNPKSIDSPFMMLAYETLPLAHEQLGAAIHPRDRTARAQLVDQKTNSRYCSLLKHFRAKTGISAVLNTSFNLHGHPLVNSPQDAIDVFLRSGLDCLALENHLVTKQ